MDAVSEIQIFFNPLDRDSQQVFEVEPGTRLIDFLTARFPAGFSGSLTVLVDLAPLDLADLDYAVRDDERVVMLVMPGGDPATWAAIGKVLLQAAVGAAIGLVINLIFRPSTPKGFDGSEESPVYSINATRNRARLGEPIASHYGTVPFPPDFASAPYVFYFEGSNDMFVDELLCLGHGDYLIEDVSVGDTPVSTMEAGTARYWQFGPDDHGSRLGAIEAAIWEDVSLSEAPVPFRENVFTSPEVEGWEFNDDRGEIITSWSSFAGTKIEAAGPHPTTGNFLNGRLTGVPASYGIRVGDTVELRNTTSNNGSFVVGSVVETVNPLLVTVFEAWGEGFLVDENPVNGAAEYRLNNITSNLEAGPFRAQKEGQLIDSIDCDIVFPAGLFHVSSSGNIRNKAVNLQLKFQQIDEVNGLPIGPPVLVNKEYIAHQRNPLRSTVSSGPLTPGAYEVTVKRVSPIRDDRNDTDTTVWAGLKGNVVLDTEAEVYGKVTILAIRMKATNGLGQAARSRVKVRARRLLASGESENPITIIKDIWTNEEYGMKRDIAEADSATLDALELAWGTEGPEFNGSFDQKGTGWEAMQNVASMAAAKVVQQNALLNVVPDRLQPIRTALFSSANILEGSLEILYTFDTEGDFDGIRVEYRDPDTFNPLYATFPEDALQPEAYTLFGCIDGIYAAEFARYLWNVKTGRRKGVKFDTELDGLVPLFGDRIGVSHPMPSWGQSGMVVEAIDATTYRLDQAMNWRRTDNYVLFRNSLGVPTAPLPVSMGATQDIILLESAPPIIVDGPMGAEPTHYTFGYEYELVKDFILTKVTPQSENVVRIEGQVYSDAIYSGAPAHMGGP